MKIALALIAVVLVGGAYYVSTMDSITMLASPETNDAPAQMQAPEMPAAAEAGAFTGSMQDLLMRAGSWQCDVTMDAGGITSSGTTYVSNGMIRGDFTSAVPQIGNISTHMIVRDEMVYTWTSMLKQGFSFPIQAGEAQGSGATAAQADMYNANHDYECRAWSPEMAKFELPSDITF